MFCTMISFYNDHNDICTLTANEGPNCTLSSVRSVHAKNGQLGPRLILLKICLTEAAQPELWTFLGLLHLPTGTVCNLLLVGPDHKEEVEAKHPAVDAEGDIREAGAGDGSYDVADVKEEPDST